MKTQQAKRPALHVVRGGASRRQQTPCEPTRESPGERGIFEEVNHPDGIRVLRFTGAGGQWLMRADIRRDLLHDLEDPVARIMTQLLDVIDPVTPAPAVRLL